MKTAEEFINNCQSLGYTNEQIETAAYEQEEPLRSQILELISLLAKNNSVHADSSCCLMFEVREDDINGDEELAVTDFTSLQDNEYGVSLETENRVVENIGNSKVVSIFNRKIDNSNVLNTVSTNNQEVLNNKDVLDCIDKKSSLSADESKKATKNKKRRSRSRKKNKKQQDNLEPLTKEAVVTLEEPVKLEKEESGISEISAELIMSTSINDEDSSVIEVMINSGEIDFLPNNSVEFEASKKILNDDSLEKDIIANSPLSDFIPAYAESSPFGIMLDPEEDILNSIKPEIDYQGQSVSNEVGFNNNLDIFEKDKSGSGDESLPVLNIFESTEVSSDNIFNQSVVGEDKSDTFTDKDKVLESSALTNSEESSNELVSHNLEEVEQDNNILNFPDFTSSDDVEEMLDFVSETENNILTFIPPYAVYDNIHDYQNDINFSLHNASDLDYFDANFDNLVFAQESVQKVDNSVDNKTQEKDVDFSEQLDENVYTTKVDRDVSGARNEVIYDDSELIEAKKQINDNLEMLEQLKLEITNKEALIEELQGEVSDKASTISEKEIVLRALEKNILDNKDKVGKFDMLKNEHKKLLTEYENMRKEYNELVVDIIPLLKKEREDLLVDVDRQYHVETKLRKELSKSGKRIIIGYAMSAVAAVLMVVLPLLHWSKAEKAERNLSMVKQEFSNLIVRLEKSELENVKLSEKYYDLAQNDKLAKNKLVKLEKKNKELVKQVDQRIREIAHLKAEMKNLALTSNDIVQSNREQMQTLSGSRTVEGSLHRNEVRDPERVLDRVVAINRQRYEEQDRELAVRNNNYPLIPVSAPVNLNVTPASASEQNADQKIKIAIVKPGEGVAQVVYRELGSRDPLLIEWVIKENKVKINSRGNPIVYPQQKLKLPTENTDYRAEVNMLRR